MAMFSELPLLYTGKAKQRLVLLVTTLNLCQVVNSSSNDNLPEKVNGCTLNLGSLCIVCVQFGA